MFLCFLSGTFAVNAQLNEFNLDVEITNETCLGNGTLTFNTTNLTPGSSLLFTVYLLPNVNEPVSVLEDNFLTGLSHGTYKIVATQALESVFNTQESTVTIYDEIEPFSISVSSTNVDCTAGDSITVSTIQGTATEYEIISGPETRPLQSSNVFNNLPAGTYNIRAFNDCGIGVVKTFTLTASTSFLEISESVYLEDITVVCDSILVSNTIFATDGEISYPVTIKYTLDVMEFNGNEVTITEVIDNGPIDSVNVSTVLPRYVEGSYDYEIVVEDDCNSFNRSNNTMDADFDISLSTDKAPCATRYIVMDINRFHNSFTIDFLSAPEDFIPSEYNSDWDSPFTHGHVEFGSEDHPVPFGEYVIEITDECGRITETSMLVEPVTPQPSVTANNNGCFSEFGRLYVSVEDSPLVDATIISAPDTYTGTLPVVVSENINEEGTLRLYDLPIGTYTVLFNDDCGFEHEGTIEVPAFVQQEFSSTSIPTCSSAVGSVRLQSGNGNLTEVIMTDAPAAFNENLPYDVSFNIADEFYMGDLPEGNYTFKATDECGIQEIMNVSVEGYIPSTTNNYDFIPGCGSFSVKVNDNSNNTETATYWLQMYNDATNSWVHPENGHEFTEGAVPDSEVAIQLGNGVTRNNLEYTGTFRILKSVQTFGSGSSESEICLGEFGQFEFFDELVIGSAYTMDCVGEPNNVYVEVLGHPTSYKIVERNGEAFVIDNGTNNVFNNLSPANYLFSIEDDCGNIVTQLFNFQELPSVTVASQPNDMLVCGTPDGTTDNLFKLTDRDEQVLGSLYSALYTITYHLTMADAEQGINPLPEYYNSTSNAQVIYARLTHNDIELCHGVTSFKLYTSDYMAPEITTSGSLCDGESIALTADREFINYLWSTGETTRTIYVTEPGIYSVVADQAYGTELCESYAEIEVTASEAPVITKIETTDWSEYNNTIIVTVQGNGTYEYSVNGSDYQESNEFANLGTGVYNVNVRDVFGCGEDNKETVLMYYPKYFTPNGDNVNDKWYIKHAVTEPNFEVVIYDRYGKLITTLKSNSDGWDGTLQGANLPSTDYWFVVNREDGRTYKGHFSMIR